MAKTKKKVILNLDEQTYLRFQELYGRTIGVSAAIRTIMDKHLQKLQQKKDQELASRNTPAD